VAKRKALRSTKSIWLKSITTHISLREDTNYTLLELSNDMDVSSKSKIVQALLDTHPDVIKKMAELREEGYFS